MPEPLPARKAHALALKLSWMPTDLWDEQLFAGSMTLEAPRVHAEWGFPDYTTEQERAWAAQRGLGIRPSLVTSCLTMESCCPRD